MVRAGRRCSSRFSEPQAPSSSALPGPVLTVQGSGSHTLGSKRGKEQEREHRLASREGANLGAEPPAPSGLPMTVALAGILTAASLTSDPEPDPPAQPRPHA